MFSMMATSIEKVKSLNKELAKASSESRTDDVIALLNQLKEAVEPTEELIRVRILVDLTQATKVGVAVGKLRTYTDARVAELAKDLVKTWKSHVEKQRRDAMSKAKSAKEAPKAEASVSKTDAASVPPTDINFEILQDKVRNACLKLLYNSLELQPSMDPKTIFATALRIEKAAYDKVGASTTNNDYRGKVRSLSLNLKDKNNPELRASVLSGEIAAHQLVVMRSEELASNSLKAQQESIRQQNLHHAKGAEAQEAETDAFQCGKCKAKKTRYYQMQTRSADEPMTTFVTCVNCNNKWKFC